MRRLLGYLLIASVLVFISTECLLAADPTPVPTVLPDSLPANVISQKIKGIPITSDYGPRSSVGSQFHRGIDYGYEFGQKVPLLQEGNIVKINKTSNLTWYLVVQAEGNSYCVRYLHIFAKKSDAQIHIHTSNHGYWSLIKTTKNGDDYYCIVKWTDSNPGTRAEYIFAEEPNIELKTADINIDYFYEEGGNSRTAETLPGSSSPIPEYVLDSDGNTAASTIILTVTDTQYIAPVGDSGPPDYKKHLHLDISIPQGPQTDPVFTDAFINPLYYMPHFDPLNPDCKVNTPFTIALIPPTVKKVIGGETKYIYGSEKEQGFWIDKNDPFSMQIISKIDSIKRKDQNQVYFYLEGTNKNNQSIKTLLREFDYGGLPAINAIDNYNSNKVINADVRYAREGLGNGVVQIPAGQNLLGDKLETHCGVELFAYNWAADTAKAALLDQLNGDVVRMSG